MKKFLIDYNTMVLLLLGLALAFIGTFHEFLSCVLSICLIGVLLCKFKREQRIVIYKNLITVAIATMSVLYLAATLWAVDSGMALIGFFKFLPVLLFLVVLMQDEGCICQIHSTLPYIIAALTIIGVVGMMVPALAEYFMVAGRLAGTFQYPNSFAIVLLVAELLLIFKDEWKKKDILVIGILLTGIVLTGSRTVVLLAIAANFAGLFLIGNKKNKITLMGIGGFAILGIIAYMMFFEDIALLERLTQVSLSESTFVGRILYMRDALPVILKHPLGTGYMGHYYLQQTIQTGVYAVRFVHNDLLQLALDIGWIPFLLFVGAIGKSLCSKNIEKQKKLILVVFFLHCCFDFDLQFIAVFYLLLTFLDIYAGEKMTIKKGAKLAKVSYGAAIGLSIVCLYMGVMLCCSVTNQFELTHKLYPWHTQNELKRIIATDDLEQQKIIADQILKRNSYVVLAHNISARKAYQDGDFTTLMQTKRKILEIAPFQYEEYEEYCYMLMNGISLYEQIGDRESAAVCWNELVNTADRLSSVKTKLSSLGEKIDDQPKTRLPLDIQRYILLTEGTYR